MKNKGKYIWASEIHQKGRTTLERSLHEPPTLIQVVPWFLDLCGISYKSLKLNWNRTPKPPTSKIYIVCTPIKVVSTNRVHLNGGWFLIPKLFLSLLP